MKYGLEPPKKYDKNPLKCWPQDGTKIAIDNVGQQMVLLIDQQDPAMRLVETIPIRLEQSQNTAILLIKTGP